MVITIALGSLFIFACGKREYPTEVETVTVQGRDYKTYRFNIPGGYFKRVWGRPFNTIYPEMVGMTKENRHRFEDGPTKLGPDKVGFIIWQSKIMPKKQKPPSPPIEQEEKKPALKSPFAQEIPLPVPEEIEESEKVKKYVKRGDLGTEGKYLITHEDGRIGVIKCSNMRFCDGYLQVKGGINIEYRFELLHFNKMVDMDRSMWALVNSFGPELVE